MHTSNNMWKYYPNRQFIIPELKGYTLSQPRVRGCLAHVGSILSNAVATPFLDSL